MGQVLQSSGMTFFGMCLNAKRQQIDVDVKIAMVSIKKKAFEKSHLLAARLLDQSLPMHRVGGSRLGLFFQMPFKSNFDIRRER